MAVDKKLYTENEQGSEVVYYKAQNEADEADYVVRKILTLHNQGVPYNEMAILMRLNSLSFEFEKKLLAYNIPHIMYNGFKFFERAEIKNVLAYLTAIVNPDDNVSFQRIINFPKPIYQKLLLNAYYVLTTKLNASWIKVLYCGV